MSSHLFPRCVLGCLSFLVPRVIRSLAALLPLGQILRALREAASWAALLSERAPRRSVMSDFLQLRGV